MSLIRSAVRGSLSDMSAFVLRGVIAAGLIALAVAPAAAGGEVGGDSRASCRPSGTAGHQICTVPLNKSLILDLPRDARDVLVSNPGIADVVVRTSRRIYLTGVAVGQTNLFVFDNAGDTIVSLDINVERDIAGLEEALRRLVPGSNIFVEMINDNIVLSGTVQNAGDSQRASEIAGIFANAGAAGGAAAPAAGGGGGDPAAAALTAIAGAVGGGDPRMSTVINLLTIEGQEQVMLRVTVAEIERNTIKQLGIDWNLAELMAGPFLFQTNSSSAFPVNTIPPNRSLFAGIPTGPESGIGVRIQSLEQTGLLRTLAQPTLTAISGETANFLAGGEFPVPVRTDGTNVIVEYKTFGVSLSFTPVVLSEGRISLRVSTEVSELTGQGALTVGGVTLPGINVRRADTTLEMPSGGALVMSGLLQDNVNQAVSGIPGVRQLPILGALFGSRDFQRNETELVIIVTPYLVTPTAPAALGRPDAGFAPAGDVGATLFGQLNLRYGVEGQTGAGTYHGNPGFIIP